MGTNLSLANLRGANLRGTDLTQAQLEETTGDENTQLPSDLKPPRTGAWRLTNKPRETERTGLPDVG